MSDDGRRILLVDDHREVARSFGRILEAAGFDVTPLFRGEDAVARLRAEPWDLVLSDLYMQGVSGVDVALVALSLDPSPAVLIMTATPDQDLVHVATEILGRPPINKGVSPEELIAEVAHALERHLASQDTAGT